MLREIFRKMPEPLKRSVTFDNGGAFAEHKTLGMDTFFCDPSAPWQHGTIENTNGIIRRGYATKNRYIKLFPQRYRSINLSHQLNTQKMPRIQNTR